MAIGNIVGAASKYGQTPLKHTLKRAQAFDRRMAADQSLPVLLLRGAERIHHSHSLDNLAVL
jgi:hypothetical protein